MGTYQNPFRPGAGHKPPYLAGRTHEQDRFRQLLGQQVITENLILTGLRGVGKTVLLETFQPISRAEGWLWTGTDMSESAGVTEERLALRLITDLSVITSATLGRTSKTRAAGFGRDAESSDEPIDFSVLVQMYQQAPGLVVDKLKTVLSFVWNSLHRHVKGIVFAYDEAQVLADHSKAGEYPLSMLLELFQSLQKQGMRYLLVLTGLPTLFPKLVDARTYAERMFHVMFLTQLDDKESREAIVRPTKADDSPLEFENSEVTTIVSMSGGYPYFIQFICKEFFDVCLSKIDEEDSPTVPAEAIEAKLDNDFFVGRWDKATDRERDLLITISQLPNCDEEFSVAEIVKEASASLKRPFSASQTNQMLARLSDKGLVFKNRYGKYSFAVPLLSRFVKRQTDRYADLFNT